MTDRSAIVIDGENFGYSFKQKSNGENLIYVRIIEDKSWNSSAYKKSFHKANKVNELDLNEIWYWKPGSRDTNTKKINLEKRFDYDRLSYFETYYPIQPKTERLLVLGFVTKGGKKTYYTRTDLKLTGKDENKISSLKTIKKQQLLDKLYEENYNQNKVLTIKIYATGKYPNVEVNKGDDVSGTEKFQKYIHNPSSSTNTYTNVVLDCSSKCEFTGLKPADYTNNNLEHVAVYFHNNDSYNTLPLLIELVPKNNQQFGDKGNNTNVYFELKKLVEKKLEDDKSEWERTYQNDTSVKNISERLSQIYSGDLKEQIDKIIGDKSTLIGAVSGSVGTISAIGTGVGGFFLYKNSALVISFLRSLF